MKYSPKLKRVMEKFKQILQEEDIAAVIVLQESMFTEYLVVVDPSYSAMNKHGIIDYSKIPKLIPTSTMLVGLSTATGHIALDLMEHSVNLERILGVETKNIDHTSHESLEN